MAPRPFDQVRVPPAISRFASRTRPAPVEAEEVTDAADEGALPEGEVAPTYRELYQDTQREIAELRKAVATQPARPEPEPAPRKSVLAGVAYTNEADTAEEAEVYAKSGIYIRKQVNRALHSLIERVIRPLEARVHELEDQIANMGHEVAESTSQTFSAALAAAVPSLARLMKTKAFNEYLDEETSDGPAGYTRRKLASSAYKNQDINSLIKLVSVYEQRAGKPATPTQDQFMRPEARGHAPREATRVPQGSLTSSQYSALLNRLKHGAISKAQFDAEKAKFTAAKAAGRFVDDTGALIPREMVGAER